jgi:hypothetical protein
MVTKKIQLLSVAVALLMPCGAHANDIDPDFEFLDVHRATSEIVIDGDLGEWSFDNPITDPEFEIPKSSGWGNGSEAVIHEEYGGGTWFDTDDQSSTSEFVWTEDGLYIGIVVTDDYHENAANSQWNGDSVQMMITTDDRASDYALYNYALGGVEEELADDPLPFGDYAIMHERGFAGFSTDVNWISDIAIVRDTEELKTYYEIFLPPDTLGFVEMVEGAEFGLGMAINDGDDDAPGQAGWVGLGAHAIVFGKTPSETALLTLVGGEPITCDPNSMGDVDGNGTVEFADFVVLSANYGNSVADQTFGDIDCNGTVEFADFVVLSANYGSTVGGAASVPEPASLGLLGFSVLFLGFLRRRNG